MTSLAPIFAALSDDTRLSIVERLMDEGELPAGAFVAVSDISGAAVSRHLKVLRNAGVIQQRSAGNHRLYSVRPVAMQAIADWTKDRRAFWEAGLDRLEAHLKEELE